MPADANPGFCRSSASRLAYIAFRAAMKFMERARFTPELNKTLIEKIDRVLVLLGQPPA